MLSVVKLCEPLKQKVLKANFRPIIERTSKVGNVACSRAPSLSAIAGKPDSASFESFLTTFSTTVFQIQNTEQVRHEHMPSINCTVPGR